MSVFATLLNPRAFAPSLDGQISLVRQLGGPFLSESVEELLTAREQGLPTGLILRDQPGETLATRIAQGLQESDAEIVAVLTQGLSTMFDESTMAGSELATALAVADGRHRMVITIGSRLAAQPTSAWRSLPMESLLFDPIADPDGWRAAATLPGECGLVLALISDQTSPPVAREALLWGLRYAATLGGRDGIRVGFTERPSRQWIDGGQLGSTEESEFDVAQLHDLLRLTSADRETLERELDPRSISPATRHKRGREDRGRS